MGIFTRMRDIISSNINAMLEKAEDPEKMIRLMIQEMEDTLVEIKAQCAGVMAENKTLERQIGDLRDRAEQWEAKAEKALDKGRDDLAREALAEKRLYTERADGLGPQKSECEALVEQYQRDIAELESKIAAVREKQRNLAARHRHARTKKEVQTRIRTAETSDVLARFEGFERRIDRMEAEADLVNAHRPAPVDERFRELEDDEELENELRELKNRRQGE